MRQGQPRNQRHIERAGEALHAWHGERCHPHHVRIRICCIAARILLHGLCEVVADEHVAADAKEPDGMYCSETDIAHAS